jgi:hypothetical protein
MTDKIVSKFKMKADNLKVFNPEVLGCSTPQEVRELFVLLWEWLIDNQEDAELRLTYEGLSGDWTKKDEDKG